MSWSRSAVLAAFSWGLLALAWWRVLATEGAPGLMVWSVPAVLAPLVALVTWWWIAHNRRIFERKGPRRAVPFATFDYSGDRRGRIVVVDPSVVAARVVTVDITPARKHYTGETR